MRFFSFIIFSVSSSLLLSGCETVQKHTKEYLPAITAVTAGAICYKTTEESNRAVATIGCAAVGTFLGSKLKEYLSEQEQQKLQEATAKSFETGEKQTVKSETGTTITTERVANSADPKSTPASQEQDCGTVKQTIVTKDNQRHDDTVSACKKDGVWVAA